VGKAIADEKMQPVLNAVNYLAGTAFTINKPVLAFMQRREEPRIQKLSAEADRLTRERELRKLSWSERQKLANLTSELTVWELDMMVANHLADHGRFLVPLQMDFRVVSIRCRSSTSRDRIISAPYSYSTATSPSAKRGCVT